MQPDYQVGYDEVEREKRKKRDGRRVIVSAIPHFNVSGMQGNVGKRTNRCGRGGFGQRGGREG
jgi:hypothetical protein